MNKAPLTESAKKVDTAHHALGNARRNYEKKRELFLRARTTLQTCEKVFSEVKQNHDQQLVETA